NALIRAGVAGLIALVTFSGTDKDRLFLIAIVFAATVYLGSAQLRFLAVRLEAWPSRWGYFRLAPPLGLLFALGVAALGSVGLVKTPGLSDLGRTILFETPSRPTLEQASELLFQLKLYIDGVIVKLLSTVVGTDWANSIGVIVSVNVLTGFVAAVYAVIIAEAVVGTEDRLL
ncbi:MAG: hypothetical protein AB7U49_03680, partial [Hyphomicrobiaceae bacterium]